MPVLSNVAYRSVEGVFCRGGAESGKGAAAESAAGRIKIRKAAARGGEDWRRKCEPLRAGASAARRLADKWVEGKEFFFA